MGDCKKFPVHITLPLATLIDLDDYRHAARKISTSDTIRYLVRVALNGGTPPPAHLSALERMRERKRARPRKQYAELSKKYKKNLDRIHITIDPEDRKDIESYWKNSTLPTRAETIRYLFRISLEEEFPPEHLKILAHLAAEKEVRDMAHRLWEQDGSHDDEPEEVSKERWFKAKRLVDNQKKAARQLTPSESGSSITSSLGMSLVDGSDVVSEDASPSIPKPHIPALSVGNLDDERH